MLILKPASALMKEKREAAGAMVALMFLGTPCAALVRATIVQVVPTILRRLSLEKTLHKRMKREPIVFASPRCRAPVHFLWSREQAQCFTGLAGENCSKRGATRSMTAVGLKRPLLLQCFDVRHSTENTVQTAVEERPTSDGQPAMRPGGDFGASRKATQFAAKNTIAIRQLTPSLTKRIIPNIGQTTSAAVTPAQPIQ
jgi:hypothetical protein